MPESETFRGGARAPEATAGPSLNFDLAQQIGKFRQEPHWQTGRNAKTLLNYNAFRIVLTTIRAKTTIHEHHSAGPISVQTIEGHTRMHAEFDLPCGRVLVFDRTMQHDVIAAEHSAFVLTLDLRERHTR